MGWGCSEEHAGDKSSPSGSCSEGVALSQGLVAGSVPTWETGAGGSLSVFVAPKDRRAGSEDRRAGSEVRGCAQSVVLV